MPTVTNPNGQNASPRVRHAGLIERFHAVLYPFDLTFLFDELPNAGWIVGERLDEAQEEGGRIKAPVKGNSRLRVDQANKTLGVVGRDPQEVLEHFKQIRALAFEVSSVAPSVETHYTEFRYIGEAKGMRSPVESLSRWWEQSRGVKEFGAVLDGYMPGDSPSGPYGLRFGSSNVDANRANWAEFTLAPVNNTGQRDYHFDLLYRNASFELVQTVVEKCVELVDWAISTVEERR
jgi:hypothetical protein